MSHVTEIIPNDIPDWMQEAMDEGQLFNRCKEKMADYEEELSKLRSDKEELEKDAARYRYLRLSKTYGGRRQHRLEWYLPRCFDGSDLGKQFDDCIDEAIKHQESKTN